MFFFRRQKPGKIKTLNKKNLGEKIQENENFAFKTKKSKLKGASRPARARADGGERGGEEDEEEEEEEDDDGPAPDDGVFEAGRAAGLVGVEPDGKKICFARKAHPIGGRRRRILRVADDARCCC